MNQEELDQLQEMINKADQNQFDELERQMDALDQNDDLQLATYQEELHKLNFKEIYSILFTKKLFSIKFQTPLPFRKELQTRISKLKAKIQKGELTLQQYLQYIEEPPEALKGCEAQNYYLKVVKEEAKAIKRGKVFAFELLGLDGKAQKAAKPKEAMRVEQKKAIPLSEQVENGPVLAKLKYMAKWCYKYVNLLKYVYSKSKSKGKQLNQRLSSFFTNGHKLLSALEKNNSEKVAPFIEAYGKQFSNKAINLQLFHGCDIDQIKSHLSSIAFNLKKDREYLTKAHQSVLKSKTAQSQQRRALIQQKLKVYQQYQKYVKQFLGKNRYTALPVLIKKTSTLDLTKRKKQLVGPDQVRVTVTCLNKKFEQDNHSLKLVPMESKMVSFKFAGGKPVIQVFKVGDMNSVPKSVLELSRQSSFLFFKSEEKVKVKLDCLQESAESEQVFGGYQFKIQVASPIGQSGKSKFKDYQLQVFQPFNPDQGFQNWLSTQYKKLYLTIFADRRPDEVEKQRIDSKLQEKRVKQQQLLDEERLKQQNMRRQQQLKKKQSEIQAKAKQSIKKQSQKPVSQFMPPQFIPRIGKKCLQSLQVEGWKRQQLAYPQLASNSVSYLQHLQTVTDEFITKNGTEDFANRKVAEHINDHCSQKAQRTIFLIREQKLSMEDYANLLRMDIAKDEALLAVLRQEQRTDWQHFIGGRLAMVKKELQI